jgi:hypothetical protein
MSANTDRRFPIISTADKLDDEVKRILSTVGIKRPNLRFSIFNDLGWTPKRWKISHPDLTSVFHHGKARFFCHGWWQGEDSYGSSVYENPLWSDVVIEAERAIRFAGGGDHVFLESVNPARIQAHDVQWFDLIFGS